MADAEGDGEGSGKGETSSEDQQLEILVEAIEIVTEVKGGVASIESEDYVTTSVSEAAASKESVDDPYEGESSGVAKLFRKVLEGESLVDVASDRKGTLNALVLNRRESGVVGSEQKCKSLQGRWMEKKNDKEIGGGACEVNLNTELRRSRLIKIIVGKKEDRRECCFHTLGQCIETYNKWCPDNSCQAWTKNSGKGKYCVLAIMVRHGPYFGGYNDLNPLDSRWALECVYVFAMQKTSLPWGV